MDIYDGKQRDIWIYDWERDTLSRLTFDPTDDSEPLWTPDGRRIAFSSKRADGNIYNIYWQAADGTGEAQRRTQRCGCLFYLCGELAAHLKTARANIADHQSRARWRTSNELRDALCLVCDR